MKRILVIGGGISGLAFAHRIKELSEAASEPVELVVVDKGSAPGGSIRSVERDGFLMECGPDSFLSEKPWATNLASRLGISDRIIGTSPEHRRTFVVHRGRLHPLPEGFYMIAPKDIGAFARTGLFSWRGKFRMIAELFVPPDRTGADESVASFVRRRFGAESLERVGQPMIAGVYSGDPEKLSILSTMPRFRELEGRYGSVIRGLQKKSAPKASMQARGVRYTLFLSFRSGLSTLPDALISRLGESVFRSGVRADELVQDAGSGQWQLRLEDARVLSADAVCLAGPAAEASRLLRHVDPRLSERLSQIRYESVATLNVAFDASQIRHPMDGFGFVVPRTEESALMACTFTHRKFPGRCPKGKVLMRAFVGGAFGKHVWGMEDEHLIRAVLKDLGGYLGISGKPLFTVLSRYPNALPQYEVGHSILIRRIERETSLMPNLALTGASYRGTGIPDCIHDAEEQAQMIWARLHQSG